MRNKYVANNCNYYLVRRIPNDFNKRCAVTRLLFCYQALEYKCSLYKDFKIEEYLPCIIK